MLHQYKRCGLCPTMPLFLRLTAPEPMLQGTRDDWGAGAYRPHHKTLQERTVHKGTAWEFCETTVCTHNFKLELEEFSFIWVIFQPLAVLLGSLYPWTAECRTCTATTAQSPRLEVEGLWVDSIAVSVFVVILVEFDKYYQKQIQIWWWDEQACLMMASVVKP